MRVTYTGGVRGVHMLADALREEGLRPEFEPLREERGLGEVIVRVVMWVGEQGAAGLVGGAATAAALRAKDKVLAKLPRSKIDVDHDEISG